MFAKFEEDKTPYKTNDRDDQTNYRKLQQLSSSIIFRVTVENTTVNNLDTAAKHSTFSKKFFSKKNCG